MTLSLLVLWFDITHTGKHTGHTGTNRLTHRITVMCTRQLPVNTELNDQFVERKSYFTILLFKNCSPLEVKYLLIRLNKSKIFLWKTNNTDRNDVNSKTHAHHTQRKIQRGLVNVSDTPFFRTTPLILPTLPIYGKILTLLLFGKISKIQLPPFIKVGGVVQIWFLFS